MTYLVTGGAGFIGSHLVETLLKKGQTVRVLDNFATGKRANLEEIIARNRIAAGDPRLTVIEGDIRDPKVCAEAVRGVDYVLHQAALPSVPRSIADPVGTTAVNVTGTLNLLWAAKEAKVKRFVFASSSSVYGDTPVLPKVESIPPNPLSPYAVSKLAGEQFCKVFHRAYGLPTVALRYFNVYGPRQDPESQYAAVIPRFVSALKAGKTVTIYGDGKQSRDFTFIDDCVRANLLACRSRHAVGEAIFLLGAVAAPHHDQRALRGDRPSPQGVRRAGVRRGAPRRRQTLPGRPAPRGDAAGLPTENRHQRRPETRGGMVVTGWVTARWSRGR